MSDPTVATAPLATDSHPRSITAPLFLWLTIQCLTLGLAAARVPLAARVEQPIERLAVHEMVVVQIVAAGMLFPFLLRDWGSTLVIVLTGWPFLLLAAMLAPVETPRLIAVGMCVSAWIVSLAFWHAAFARSIAAQLTLSAVATAFALGGPALWYLRAEFGHASPILEWPRDSVFGPAMAALAQLHAPHSSTLWIVPAMLLALGAGAFIVRVCIDARHAPRNRQLIHRPSPDSSSPNVDNIAQPGGNCASLKKLEEKHIHNLFAA